MAAKKNARKPVKENKRVDDVVDDDVIDIEELPDLGGATDSAQQQMTAPPSGAGMMDSPPSFLNAEGMDMNPFKEIAKLINSDDIKSKSILTGKQIIILTKLETVRDMYIQNDFIYQAKQIDLLVKNFMVLVISKDGTSRKQFIEAMQRGSDRAENIAAMQAMRMQGGGMRV